MTKKENLQNRKRKKKKLRVYHGAYTINYKKNGVLCICLLFLIQDSASKQLCSKPTGKLTNNYLPNNALISNC